MLISFAASLFSHMQIVGFLVHLNLFMDKLKYREFRVTSLSVHFTNKVEIDNLLRELSISTLFLLSNIHEIVFM